MTHQVEQYIPVKGLNKDFGKTVFSKEFLYNLINGRISHNKKSDLFTITNFKGNQPVTQKQGIVLGYCITGDYLTLLVTEKVNDSVVGNLDVIYRFTYLNGEVDSGVELYRGDFGFSPTRAIETLGNYESEDLIKVYFTDAPNPPRMINIVQDTYINDSNYPNGYVSQFDFVPKLELNENYSITKYFNGGVFHSGTVQYVFTYLRKNGAQSNIFISTGINFVSEKQRAAALDEVVNCSFLIVLTGLENTHFDYVRGYAIERHDLNGTPVVRQLNDYPLGSSKIMSITDDGSGSIVDANSLLTLGGEPLTASTLESKDNHLFLGDINLLRPTLKDLKDISIIGHSEFIESSEVAFFETLQEGKIKNGTSANADTVYAYSPNSLHKDSVKGSFRGFKTGEVYRFAIQAQHETGVWSEALYIEDKQCNLNLTEEMEKRTGGYTTIKNIVYRVSLTVDFKEGLRQRGYKKVRLLYVPLTKSDRRVVTQGIINSTLFNRVDYENNSYGLYADYLTRVQPIVDQEFKFLYSPNSNYLLYGFYNEMQRGYTNPFSFSFRFPQKYHGVLLQNTAGSFELGIGENTMISYGSVYGQSSETVLMGNYSPFTLFEMSEKQLSKNNPMAINRAYYSLFSPEIYHDYYLGKGFGVDDNIKCDVVGIVELSFSNTGVEMIDDNKSIKKSTTQAFDKWASRYGGFTSSHLTFETNTDWFPNTYQEFEYEHVYTPGFNNSLYPAGPLAIFAKKIWSDKGKLLYKHQYRNLYFGRTFYFRSKRISPLSGGDRTYRMIYDIKENYFAGDSVNNITIENKSYASDVRKLIGGLATDEDKENMSKLELKSNLLNYRVNNHLLFTFSNTSFIDFTPKRSDDIILPNTSLRADQYESEVFDTGDYKRKRALPLTLMYVNHQNEVEQTIYNLPASYRGWLRKEPVSSLVTKDYTVTNVFIDLAEANPNIQRLVASQKRVDNLFIADITRDVKNQYGGQSKTATPEGNYVFKADPLSLVNNLFIPCGEAYSLDTPYIWATDGDTYIQRFDFSKTQPFDPDYWQQLYETISYIGTSYINLDGRYDKYRTTKNFLAKHKGNYGLVNMAYSQLNNFFTYRILDYNKLNEDAKPSSIVFSLQKYNQELTDKWLNINLASMQDLDGRAGRLRKIINFNGRFLAFQDSVISEIVFNPRVQIPTSDNIPIEITNTGKFQTFAPLNHMSGCTNKWTIKATSGKLFYIDSLNKDIMAITSNGFENLTVQHGFKSWADKFLSPHQVFNPKDCNGFTTSVDNVNGDVYFNWKPSSVNVMGKFIHNLPTPYDDLQQWGSVDYFHGSLLFNDNFSFFETELMYENVPFMFNIGSDFFSVKNDSQNNKFTIYKQNVNTSRFHFGSYKPTYIDYMMVPHYPLDKVFSSISYKHELYDIDNNHQFVHNRTFEDIFVKNNYQSGKMVLQTDVLSYHTKKKFNTWGVVLPRELGTMNRIRSQWLRLRLKYNIDDKNYDMQLHELELNYTI